MAEIYREMTIADYDEVQLLWRQTEGICVREADSRGQIERYLLRNPGLCSVVLVNDQVIGTILAGHDGRRGYLHHLAVMHKHRRLGMGKRLVDRAISALRVQAIQKCHIFVLQENQDARIYWRNRGWTSRPDIEMMSFNLSENPNELICPEFSE